MPAPETFLDTDKSLACVHCGLCLGACPTYLETGNENDSPRGRIYLMRAVQDGRMKAEEARDHIDLCLGCRACEVACPSGVEYGNLLESTREHLEQKVSRSFFQTILRRWAIERVFPFKGRMKLALLPARIVRALGLTSWLPKFIRDSLNLLPEKMEAGGLPRLSPARGERKGTVGFISGCVMDVMFGETHRNSVRLLNEAGYDVVTPTEQVCCGALYAHGGQLDQARSLARENIRIFGKEQLDAIVINAAGCGSTLKEYGHLLEGDKEWHEAGEQFSSKVKDLSEFLVDVGFIETLRQRAPAATDNAVTFHDACHLAHPQRITSQPRQLVQIVAGEGFTELPESDVCCGSAGSYNLTEPEMAERLQKRKIGRIKSTQATTVVTTNPGCLLQIQAGLKAAGQNVRALHIADYLAESLGRMED
ncbi:MAG: (Fe-S)-binding protein [Limisphaerales bacterium]